MSQGTYPHTGLRLLPGHTTGRYRDGRPVWVFLRCGRFELGGWYAHLEVGSHVLDLSYGTWWLENLMLRVRYAAERLLEGEEVARDDD